MRKAEREIAKLAHNSLLFLFQQHWVFYPLNISVKFNLTYYQGLSWLNSFYSDYLDSLPCPILSLSLSDLMPHPPLSDFFLL